MAHLMAKWENWVCSFAPLSLYAEESVLPTVDHSVNVVGLSSGKLGAAFTTEQKPLILY